MLAAAVASAIALRSWETRGEASFRTRRGGGEEGGTTPHAFQPRDRARLHPPLCPESLACDLSSRLFHKLGSPSSTLPEGGFHGTVAAPCPLSHPRPLSRHPCPLAVSAWLAGAAPRGAAPPRAATAGSRWCPGAHDRASASPRLPAAPRRAGCTGRVTSADALSPAGTSDE